jgi:hypothetical protein
MLSSGQITKREANHMRWQDSDPVGSHKAKARLARDTAIARAQSKRPSRRYQRNNFREY